MLDTFNFIYDEDVPINEEREKKVKNYLNSKLASITDLINNDLGSVNCTMHKDVETISFSGIPDSLKTKAYRLLHTNH